MLGDGEPHTYSGYSPQGSLLTMSYIYRIFILEGVATIAAGLVAFWAISDSPVKATFLTPDERAWLV